MEKITTVGCYITVKYYSRRVKARRENNDEPHLVEDLCFSFLIMCFKESSMQSTCSGGRTY